MLRLTLKLRALQERSVSQQRAADTQQERTEIQQERIDLAARELAEISDRLQAAANALPTRHLLDGSREFGQLTSNERRVLLGCHVRAGRIPFQRLARRAMGEGSRLGGLALWPGFRLKPEVRRSSPRARETT
jgi:hypothetical protein